MKRSGGRFNNGLRRFFKKVGHHPRQGREIEKEGGRLCATQVASGRLTGLEKLWPAGKKWLSHCRAGRPNAHPLEIDEGSQLG